MSSRLPISLAPAGSRYRIVWWNAHHTPSNPAASACRAVAATLGQIDREQGIGLQNISIREVGDHAEGGIRAWSQSAWKRPTRYGGKAPTKAGAPLLQR
jgi:hypothetical protein